MSMSNRPKIVRSENLFLGDDLKNASQETIKELDLCMVTEFFDEYIQRITKNGICDEESLRHLWRGGHFRFSDEPRWLVKRSVKDILFEIWGSQLAVGANSFVI